jgi:peptidoglycan/LPS O-acetylase OafA/YrhL
VTVSVAGWVGYEALALHHGRLYGLAPDALGRPELAQDYLVAGLFALHLAGICHLSDRVARLIRPAAKPIRWLAGATFSIYLMHYPLLQFIAAAMPWPLTSGLAQVLLLILTLTAVFLMAELSERRKESWRRAIQTVCGRLFPPLAEETVGGGKAAAPIARAMAPE